MYSLGLIFILQYFLKELYGINDTVTNAEKKALRFGFHQTYDCQVFEKAFKCIRKCLDEKFDVAYADKNCACTCYHKKDKEKYRHLAMIGKGQTVPTTKLPAWAMPQNLEPDVHLDDENAEENPTTVADTDAGPVVQNANASAIGDAAHAPEVTGADAPAGEAAAEGEEAPAEGEDAPAEGEEAPAEGEEAPAEGEEAPAEGEEAAEEK